MNLDELNSKLDLSEEKKERQELSFAHQLLVAFAVLLFLTGITFLALLYTDIDPAKEPIKKLKHVLYYVMGWTPLVSGAVLTLWILYERFRKQ